jgi:hypothetical protein
LAYPYSTLSTSCPILIRTGFTGCLVLKLREFFAKRGKRMTRAEIDTVLVRPTSPAPCRSPPPHSPPSPSCHLVPSPTRPRTLLCVLLALPPQITMPRVVFPQAQIDENNDGEVDFDEFVSANVSPRQSRACVCACACWYAFVCRGLRVRRHMPCCNGCCFGHSAQAAAALLY